MKYHKLDRVCEPDEGTLDSTPEEKIRDSHSKLTLVSKIHPTDRSFQPLPQKIKDDSSDELSESAGNFNPDPWEETPSSLSIYLKTINSIPLLSDEEEKILGKRIKECEKECKDLVIKWKQLFKNKFLQIFSDKDEKTIHKELQQIKDSLNLFDNLATLEKERKKVEKVLQEKNQNVRIQEKLQENLYKIAAEIAKCIAKITLNKDHIERTLYSLKAIPAKKSHASKRLHIENDLKRMLVDISRLSREIKKLKSELVHANQKLVTTIARKYSHYGLELPDMIQEGNLGLIRAIDTFDYQRGYRFMTYAKWWIRQSLIRALQCKLRTIKKPNHMNEKLTKIVKISNRLYQECEREPTVEEIAQEINISPEFIEQIIHHFNDTKSMDTLIEEGRENGSTHSFCQKRNPILDRVIFTSLSQTLHVLLTELPIREREVIKLRFGIGGCDYHTLEEIGVKFDFTRERSRQILASGLKKMKKSKHMIQLKDFSEYQMM